MWYVPEKILQLWKEYKEKQRMNWSNILGYGIGSQVKKLGNYKKKAKNRGKWQDNFVIVNFDILDEVYQIPVSRSQNIDKVYKEVTDVTIFDE